LGFEAQKKTILCGDKSLVKGHYLIDDHHKDGQTEFEGKWIQIGNEKYQDWKSVVEEIDRDVMDKY
jgi:5'(3')-deoxyribonucleotidase